MTRTITAIYDSEADARRAREQLLSSGVDDDDVRVVSQNLSRTDVSTDDNVGSDDNKGMWESIKDFFVGDDDRPMYSESLRRGSYLLTARVDDDLSDEAISVLEQTNAVDLDERTQQWRSEGWTESAYPPSSMSGYAAGAGATTDTISAQLSDTSSERTGSEVRDTDETAIPIVEERLRVGKREVERGSVRVRSYVVEEPVHEQVALREEHVAVERRPVSDRATAGAIGDDAFKERTIELTERAEEAVIAKDAVVTEEVVVRKSAEERTETIEDTVRHTEVDIDDSTRSGKAGTRRTTRKPS